MKKTHQTKKLVLDRTIVRELLPADLGTAAGGNGQKLPPPTGNCHSVYNSCRNTDCCLELP